MSEYLIDIESFITGGDADFEIGDVYCFLSDGADESNYAVGIIDCISEGRVVLEVAQFSDVDTLNFYVELPARFTKVRRARRWELRDFMFNYGFYCGSKDFKNEAICNVTTCEVL